MKYVGDAIRDYALASGNATRTNVVAIGIATWGVIDQRDKLINEKVHDGGVQGWGGGGRRGGVVRRG